MEAVEGRDKMRDKSGLQMRYAMLGCKTVQWLVEIEKARQNRTSDERIMEPAYLCE